MTSHNVCIFPFPILLISSNDGFISYISFQVKYELHGRQMLKYGEWSLFNDVLKRHWVGVRLHMKDEAGSGKSWDERKKIL